MGLTDVIRRRGKSVDEDKKDFYQTDPVFIRALISGMKDLRLYSKSIGDTYKILDPCAGEGAIGNVLKEYFNPSNIVEYDLYSGYTFERDFLEETGKYDYVTFNSPYSNKNAFIEHGLKVGNFVFSLLPIGVENYTIMNEKFFDTEAYVGKIKCYPKCFMTDDISGKLKFGGMSCYAWHIFTADYDWQRKYSKQKFEVIKDIRKFL